MHISICENVMRLFRVAMVTIACTLAMSGPTLAQSITVAADEARTASIRVLTDGATVTNNGTITTGDCAILLIVSNVTVTNNGTIMTTGNNGAGVCASNPNKSGIDIINATGGTITTSGTSNLASGIMATGTDGTVTNTGTITTSGEQAHGISTSFSSITGSPGTNIRITNAAGGTITTSGEQAHGINSAGNTATGNTSPAGANAILTNAGTITAQGIGIYSNGADAVITNSGSITTTGLFSYGIISDGAMATISNAGTLSTTGDNAHGIISAGADAGITSSGSISTTGMDAHGIVADGDNAVITISGAVSATGTASYAVKGSDAGDQKLILLSGASLSGEAGQIDLGTRAGDSDTVEITGNVVLDCARVTGVEGFRVNGINLGGTCSTGGGMMVTLDPTGSSATRMALGYVTGQIHRQVLQRLAFAPAPQVTQGAGVGQDRRSWGTFFGSRSERGENGQALAWKHTFQGMVLGYDADIESGQRVGLFAGFGQDKIKTSEITSITDTANRGFVGIYGQHVTGNLTLNGALVFGRASHKSTRTVGDNTVGTETAKGSYNSTTISPSLRLNWSRALPNGLELRPSARVSYTYGSYSGYTETGTTNSNATFGKRHVNIVDSRLQLALAQPFAADRGEIEWRAGVTSTHYGNNSASAQLPGKNAMPYKVPGDRSLFGSFVGATLHYAINDRVSLGGDVEYARTSGDASGGISGQLGLQVRF